MFKKCTKCGENKPATIEYFYANKGGRYGLRGMCIPCCREIAREQIKKPEIAARRRELAAKDVESGVNAKRQREWRKKNPESVKSSALKWKSKNKDHNREVAKRWRDSNREKCRAKQRRVDAALQAKPSHVIKKRLKARLRKMVKKGTVLGSSEKIFMFTREELIAHLESKFTDGMSWDAFMRGEVHIDHKIPVSAFNITSINDPEFIACWGLDNLQPLWARDNYTKGSKISV